MILWLKSMVDTFYLHLEFTGKKGDWSVNLPFLCTRCGICCTLDDFLTAGEIVTEPKKHQGVHWKIETLFDELGKMWADNEAKHDEYIQRTPCPFLVNNICSIYEIRPGGCRLFPKTVFGMQTRDCAALNRFKKQRASLKKGKTCKEIYGFAGKNAGAKLDETIMSVVFTEKQFQTCINRLRDAGITDEELKLFSECNEVGKL